MTELGYKKRGDRRMASERQLGFTIIELMFTLVVASILLGIGIPSFQETIKNNRIVATSNGVASAIGYARTEAVKRGGTVHVGFGDATTDFVVWIDADGGNDWDPSEELLRTWPVSAASVSITSGNARTFYAFRGTGEVNANDTITVCDDRSGERGSQYTLLLSGSVSRADFPCS